MICSWVRDTGVASAGNDGIERCGNEAREGKALCEAHWARVLANAMRYANASDCLKCRLFSANATASGGGVWCDEHRRGA